MITARARIARARVARWRIAEFRSVRECLDQQHAHLDTPKQDRADDNLLSDKKRIHPCTSPEDSDAKNVPPEHQMLCHSNSIT
jgi:hypothetical protein